MEQDKLSTLCDGGLVELENPILKNIMNIYQKGKGPTIVWEPPKEGTDVLILEHFNSERCPLVNNNYRMEKGNSRKYIVYHVERYEMHSDYFYSGSNVVILSFQIGKLKQERRMRFSDFTSGLYVAEELTAENIEEVRHNREELNERGYLY